jgi:hypothetical protein
MPELSSKKIEKCIGQNLQESSVIKMIRKFRLDHNNAENRSIKKGDESTLDGTIIILRKNDLSEIKHKNRSSARWMK